MKIFAAITLIVTLFIGGIWAYTEFQVGSAVSAGLMPVVIDSAKNAGTPYAGEVATGLSVASDIKEIRDTSIKSPVQGAGKLFGFLDVQPFNLVLLGILVVTCFVVFKPK